MTLPDAPTTARTKGSSSGATRLLVDERLRSGHRHVRMQVDGLGACGAHSDDHRAPRRRRTTSTDHGGLGVGRAISRAGPSLPGTTDQPAVRHAPIRVVRADPGLYSWSTAVGKKGFTRSIGVKNSPWPGHGRPRVSHGPRSCVTRRRSAQLDFEPVVLYRFPGQIDRLGQAHTGSTVRVRRRCCQVIVSRGGPRR